MGLLRKKNKTKNKQHKTHRQKLLFVHRAPTPWSAKIKSWLELKEDLKVSREKTPQPLCTTCARALLPAHGTDVLPGVQEEPPVLQVVPRTPHPGLEHL